MPTSVKGQDGHEMKVVDHEDLLMMERAFRNWLLGMIGGLIAVIVACVITVVTIRNELNELSRNVKTLQTSGSDVVRQMQIDIAVIRERQSSNSVAIQNATSRLEEIAEFLGESKRRAK